MISVATLAGVPEWVRQTFGDSVLRHANRAAMIDIELIEDQDCFIPQATMMRYLREIERRGGEERFALLLAPHLSFSSYGLWAEYVLACGTLRDAVTRAGSTLGYHSLGDRMELSVVGGTARLSYVNATRGLAGYANVAIGSAGVVLDLIGSYASSGWRPDLIELDIPRPPSATPFEDAFGCPVAFDATAVALRFDSALLDRPLRRVGPPNLLTFADLVRLRFPPDSVGDFTGAVTALVWAQVLAGTPSIQNAARSLGTSVRTLQRELNRDGADFRGLVTRIRVQRAKELLTETRGMISEISSALGYSSPANFSRAFRNATGTTPLDFRSR